jgi:hypothetical protein
VICVNRNERRHVVYRVIQEEILISWEVRISVSVSKKDHICMCPILKGPRQSCLNLQIKKNVVNVNREREIAYC